MITSSTSLGFTPARFTASRTTIAPRSVALKCFSAPRSLPTGVRTALMITGCLTDDILIFFKRVDLGLLLMRKSVKQHRIGSPTVREGLLTNNALAYARASDS